MKRRESDKSGVLAACRDPAVLARGPIEKLGADLWMAYGCTDVHPQLRRRLARANTVAHLFTKRAVRSALVRTLLVDCAVDQCERIGQLRLRVAFYGFTLHKNGRVL
jgi:hypothetical protein